MRPNLLDAPKRPSGITCHLMEPFEYEGIFWEPSAPERIIAGRLSFQPSDGLTLDLVGSFDDLPEAFSQAKQITPRRIVGAAGGKQVTLHHCLVTNVSLDGPGLLRQRFYVFMLLEGAQFTADDDLSFESVMVGFDQLPQWIGQSPFTVTVESEQPNDLTSATKLTFTTDLPKDKSEVTDDIEVRLTHTWTIGGNRVTEIKSSVHPILGLKYKERRALTDILMDVDGLQDLVSLAVDATAVPNNIELRRSDLVFAASPDKHIEVPIILRWRRITDDARTTGRPANNTVFFAFNQVNGLEAVARWISVSRRYRLVLGLMLTIRYSPRLYAENQFSNLIQAAETFHRMRFSNELISASEYKSQKRKLVGVIKSMIGPRIGEWLKEQLAYGNEPRLSHRLAELADYAGEGFSALVNDVNDWTRATVRLRNRMIHYDPKRPPTHNTSDLGDITDSLFVLIMLALFRECELPDDIFDNLTRSPRLALLHGRLAEVIPRLAK